MNFIKKWILTRLGYICPKCGGKLVRQYVVCNANKQTYGYAICKNHKWINPFGKCNYNRYFKL
jgi:hypothetical protein